MSSENHTLLLRTSRSASIASARAVSPTRTSGTETNSLERSSRTKTEKLTLLENKRQIPKYVAAGENFSIAIDRKRHIIPWGDVENSILVSNFENIKFIAAKKNNFFCIDNEN